jgi:hypothetical protein
MCSPTGGHMFLLNFVKGQTKTGVISIDPWPIGTAGSTEHWVPPVLCFLGTVLGEFSQKLLVSMGPTSVCCIHAFKYTQLPVSFALNHRPHSQVHSLEVWNSPESLSHKGCLPRSSLTSWSVSYWLPVTGHWPSFPVVVYLCHDLTSVLQNCLCNLADVLPLSYFF